MCRTTLAWSIFVLAVFCVQTVVFLVVNALWVKQRFATTENVETKICCACENLIPRREISTGTLNANVRNMKSDDDTICCGESGFILKQAARKYVIDEFYQRVIGSVPIDVLCQPKDLPDTPQGKIVGVVKFASTHSQGFHRLLWNKNSRTITRGGLMHLEEEGEIFIRKPGKYFVSARLNLGSNSSLESVGDSVVSVGDSVVSVGDSVVSVGDTVTLRMSVLSHTLGFSRVVLETKRSLDDERAWSVPMQFGALFDFYEYDRVSLSISHPSFVTLNATEDQFIATFQQ